MTTPTLRNPPTPRLSRRRQRIADTVAEFRSVVAAARGAAQRGLDQATTLYDETCAELILLDSNPDVSRETALADPRMARIVKRVQSRRRRVFAPWLTSGPARVAKVVTACAPGTAGEPTEHWLGQVGKADGSGTPARLWRLGVGRVGGQPEHGFPVATGLLDVGHVQITVSPQRHATAEGLIENLLLRVVSHYRPGLVRVHVWDAGQHAGTLPGLYPLTQNRLLTIHSPDQLGKLLEQLADRITRIRTSALVDGHSSLRALAATVGGERVEPWHVVVLVGDGEPLNRSAAQQLQRVARAGPACGIHLIAVNIPDRLVGDVERIYIDADVHTSSTGPHVDVELDRPIELTAANRAARVIADWWADWLARDAVFADLLPPVGQWGKTSSAKELVAPAGFDEHNTPVDAVLGDQTPHALICGPSGSGKTNFILAWLAALAARYGPDELELYLLDFKEGVSFAQLGAEHGDDTYLPHARLVGVNINEDPEFGLALLQYLSAEMRRRAAAAKARGVTKLEELRGVDPDGQWTRIVAVIDEFQLLFQPGEVAKAAVVLLEDIARRGRSQGIHLVLASQDIGGIRAFWGVPGVFEQFVLRIGLPRATRVMDSLNKATLNLRRFHAVVNHDSGMAYGNVEARIPNAVEPGSFDLVQQRLHREYGDEHPPPVLFDGSRAPALATLMDVTPPGRFATIGQAISVTGRPAVVAMRDEPGRNLAVMGSGRDAATVLSAAVTSLRVREPDAQILRWEAGQEGLQALLQGAVNTIAERHVSRETSPVVLALYGADAIEPTLGKHGLDALRQILRRGPEVGVHVLGWWRSVQRLRALLTMGASVDDVGSWVACDVHGGELGSLIPGTRISAWHPRPGRGLWFDRAIHSVPEAIFVPALEEEA